MTRAERAACVTLAAALSGVLGHGVAGAADATPATPPPGSPGVAAAWKPHTIALGDQGLTTRYSCVGIEQKMRTLLRWFGARPESIRVRTHGCAGGPYRPAPAIQLELEFETLAPAEGSSAAVRGVWLERDLFGETRVSRDAPSHIGRSDCELIQRFVAEVLPAFTHEIRRNLTRCVPHDLGASAPNLRVRVLAPAPAPPAHTRDAAPAGEATDTGRAAPA